MKYILALCIFAGLCEAQTLPKEIAGAGVSWNQYTSPAIVPFAFYAHRITGSLYSFTEYMATSIQRDPLHVQFTGDTGAAVHVKQFGRVSVMALGTIGGSHVTTEEEGTQAGFSYGLGGAAGVPLKAGWYLLFPVRVLKASLPDSTGASDYQFKFSVAICWGK